MPVTTGFSYEQKPISRTYFSAHAFGVGADTGFGCLQWQRWRQWHQAQLQQCCYFQLNRDLIVSFER